MTAARVPIVELDPPRGGGIESPLHSQGVLLPDPGGLVLVSGQVGVRPDGTRGVGVEQQTRIVFANIARVLAAAGLALDAVASLRTYVTAHEDIATFARTARDCLDGHRPAATLLVVEHLADPSLLVQVEAVAVEGGRREPPGAVGRT